MEVFYKFTLSILTCPASGLSWTKSQILLKTKSTFPLTARWSETICRSSEEDKPGVHLQWGQQWWNLGGRGLSDLGNIRHHKASSVLYFSSHQDDHQATFWKLEFWWKVENFPSDTLGTEKGFERLQVQVGNQITYYWFLNEILFQVKKRPPIYPFTPYIQISHTRSFCSPLGLFDFALRALRSGRVTHTTMH